jgi:hypothetical protein
MADDRSKRGGPDRQRVSAEEGYEVAHFANKHGITLDEARDIIQRHGPSRAQSDAAAEKLKGRGR